jgi:hypothetical protein
MNQKHKSQAAFDAGVKRGATAAANKPCSDERLEAMQIERDREREEKERHQTDAFVVRLLASRRIDIDSVDAKYVFNVTENERRRCKRTGERFDPAFTALSAIYQRGHGAAAPVDPRGTPPPAPLPPGNHAGAGNAQAGALAPIPAAYRAPVVAYRPPTTPQEVQAERARFRARLAELGLVDPSTGSFAGGEGHREGGVVR